MPVGALCAESLHNNCLDLIGLEGIGNCPWIIRYYAASSKFLLPCKARPEFEREEQEGPRSRSFSPGMIRRTRRRRSISCFDSHQQAGTAGSARNSASHRRRTPDSVCVHPSSPSVASCPLVPCGIWDDSGS